MSSCGFWAEVHVTTAAFGWSSRLNEVACRAACGIASKSKPNEAHTKVTKVEPALARIWVCLRASHPLSRVSSIQLGSLKPRLLNIQKPTECPRRTYRQQDVSQLYELHTWQLLDSTPSLDTEDLVKPVSKSERAGMPSGSRPSPKLPH